MPAAVAAGLAALLLDTAGGMADFLRGALLIVVLVVPFWAYGVWTMRRRQPNLLPEDAEVRPFAQVLRAIALKNALWAVFSLLMTILLGTFFAGVAAGGIVTLPLILAAIAYEEHRRSKPIYVPSREVRLSKGSSWIWVVSA